MITKPGFLLKRITQLFNSTDIEEQQRIVDAFNKQRNNKCYCGHTIRCDCGNPGLSEFKSGLHNGGITELTLNNLL